MESLSHTGDSGSQYSTLFRIILFLSLNSVKTFRENSNRPCLVFQSLILYQVRIDTCPYLIHVLSTTAYFPTNFDESKNQEK